MEGQSAPALSNVPVGGSASPAVGGPATSLVGGSASPSRGGLAGSGSPLLYTGEVHPGSDSRVHFHRHSLGEEEKIGKINNNGGRF